MKSQYYNLLKTVKYLELKNMSGQVSSLVNLFFNKMFDDLN